MKCGQLRKGGLVNKTVSVRMNTESYQLQNFGNFNFGATGTAAGIAADILLMGAGWAQSRAGTRQSNWGHWYSKPPYGDDPRDQFWIKQGIDYAKQHGF